jgi:hypothetical protein
VAAVIRFYALGSGGGSCGGKKITQPLITLPFQIFPGMCSHSIFSRRENTVSGETEFLWEFLPGLIVKSCLSEFSG